MKEALIPCTLRLWRSQCRPPARRKASRCRLQLSRQTPVFHLLGASGCFRLQHKCRDENKHKFSFKISSYRFYVMLCLSKPTYCTILLHKEYCSLSWFWFFVNLSCSFGVHLFPSPIGLLFFIFFYTYFDISNYRLSVSGFFSFYLTVYVILSDFLTTYFIHSCRIPSCLCLYVCLSLI